MSPAHPVAQRRVAAASAVVLVAGAAAVVVLVVTVLTPLQEVSFRWVGLAGIALPVALGVAAVCTGAATLWSWAAAPGRARAAVTTAALVVPWVLVLGLGWPTWAGLLAPEQPGEGARVSLLSQNLWYQNPDPAATAEELLALDTDVMVLVEYTPAHAEAFRAAGVARRYPYRWEEPGELGGGLAVMSRVPFDEVDRLDTWSGAVRMTLATGAGAVELYAVHPVAPSDFWGLRRWKGDYRTLTAALRDAGPATVVAGDFNATRSHRRLRALMGAAGLRDTQDVAGAGFGATWPSNGWVPPVMRLDHVLVGDAVGAESFEVLDAVGADHRGVLATLRVRGEDAAVG